MRVTMNMLYGTFVQNMNTSLTNLMDLNIQAQTQKKVNSPSDDPVGMARILDHRDALAKVKKYQENIDTAQGWLNLSDQTLTQVSEQITRAKTLAEQAATGTLSADNREEISYEVRQLYEQMIALANTEFAGQSIYAGQKTDTNPFRTGLNLTTNDSAFFNNQSWNIEGDTDKTILVQFEDTGALSTNPDFRYTRDGGDTWQTGTVVTNAAGDYELDMNGVRMTFDADTNVRASADYNDSNGTWVWVRPSAYYQGDDEDKSDVNGFFQNNTITTTAQGNFQNDVQVRFGETDPADPNRIRYAYSTNNGSTWTNGDYIDRGAVVNTTISLPGGTVTINNANQLNLGDSFVVHPRSADINFDIGENERIQVNDVGKDIFGGLYQDPASNAPATVFSTDSLYLSNAGQSKNLLETMGNLVAFLETNNQQGIQQCLEALGNAQEHVLNKNADVGGRENRLTVAKSVLQSVQLNEEERISKLEDVDMGELMTELAQAEIVYNAVLKSSSMIMNLNLLKFV